MARSMKQKMNRQQRRSNPTGAELEAHERECAVRYENVEKRLDAGQARFMRLENMIWGLYGLLIVSSIIGEVIN
jgi:hypothetical protein